MEQYVNGDLPIFKSPSAADLETIDRSSPAPSTSSLEKYLATPVSEEGLSTAAVEAATQDIVFRVPCTPNYARRPSSVAGTDSSMSSNNSNVSCSSFKSVDVRGPRRGRKLWRPALLSKAEGESPLAHSAKSLSKQNDREAFNPCAQPSTKNPFFCTWPGCGETFWSRYAWRRHEETAHYRPYHWVCCLNDSDSYLFENLSDESKRCLICSKTCEHTECPEHLKVHNLEKCKGKDLGARTFFRKDHLEQHIKTTHWASGSGRNEISFLLSFFWKTSNPNIPKTFYCGFCNASFGDWRRRQIHVFRHLDSSDNTGPEYKLKWRQRDS